MEHTALSDKLLTICSIEARGLNLTNKGAKHLRLFQLGNIRVISKISGIERELIQSGRGENPGVSIIGSDRSALLGNMFIKKSCLGLV